jgi:putative DNA primase/helicase
MTTANADFMNAENVRTFAPGDSWPEPDETIINAGAREAPALPVDLFSPHTGASAGAAACIIEEAQRRSCPVDYIAGSMLAAGAALIGNSRRVRPWGSWIEPVALNVGLVGSPSMKKSPAADAILDPVKKLEREMSVAHGDTLRDFETRSLSAKLLHQKWESDVETALGNGCPAPTMPEEAQAPERPGCPRITATDATVPALADVCVASRKGVLLFRDELAGWLQNLGAYGGDGDRAFFIEAYGGRSYSIDRKKNATRIEIPRLLVSILGGIQPDKLATALLRGDDDGFAARFLYFWPQAVPFKRPHETGADTGLTRALYRLHLLDLQPIGEGEFAPVILPLTEGAASAFGEWCSEITTRGNESQGLMAGLLGKAGGGVLRLAAVLAHFDWAFGPEAAPPECVSVGAIQRAMVLYDEYLLPMAERTFGDAARPERERLAAILARQILKRREGVQADAGQVSVRDIQRNWKPVGLDTAEKVKAALGALSDADWLRDISDRAGDTAGRKRTAYQVNPKIWRLSA